MNLGCQCSLHSRNFSPRKLRARGEKLSTSTTDRRHHSIPRETFRGASSATPPALRKIHSDQGFFDCLQNYAGPAQR